MLPDEILLAVFFFFVDKDAFRKKDIEAWQSLVHVCRRWRSVVFGSPRRLNLRLVCGANPVRGTLDVWPPLPLVIRGSAYQKIGMDNNILAGLERSDCVCRINLWGYDRSHRSPLKVLVAMQKPFPELTDLVMDFETATVLPDSFLDGSAPRLQKLHLDGIPFPGLPKLLLSATHLVDLHLSIRYISPKAMATALLTLTSLKLLRLKFLESSQSRLDQVNPRLPPTRTRSLLPVLDTLWFEGDAEYLDDLVALIDAPRLNNLDVVFPHRIISDIPKFSLFTGRTLTLEALEKAYVAFEFDGASVKLSSQMSGHGKLKVKILCRGLNQKVSSLTWFCTSYLPLPTLEDLYVYWDVSPRLEREDHVESIQWLELFHPFSAVKNLYLSKDSAPHIGRVVQELVGESTTEVLPIMQNIFLERSRPRRPVPESIKEFVAARQLSGRPITVSTIPRNLMRSWVMMFDYYFDN